MAGADLFWEKNYFWLIVSSWFVLREKNCWLMADKPNEQDGIPMRIPRGQIVLERIELISGPRRRYRYDDRTEFAVDQSEILSR
jgi:hypothetical protein